jgi:hypothetical protein
MRMRLQHQESSEIEEYDHHDGSLNMTSRSRARVLLTGRRITCKPDGIEETVDGIV